MGTIIFTLVGGALWVAAGVLLYFRGRTLRKSAVMQRVQTSSASEVSGMAPGTLVEVEGTLRCENPLVAEMSGKECAYYSSRVIREYLRADHDDDNDVGSDRRSETVAHNEQFVAFSVEDATGSVPVNAEGAEFDARQVVNRFERDTGSETSISLGGVNLRLGGGERTLGFRYQESILPVDAPVYVLGAAQDDGSIGALPPGEKDARFIVSHRSEESLGASLGRNALMLGLIALGLFVFGVIFVAVGVAAALGYIQFQ